LVPSLQKRPWRASVEVAWQRDKMSKRGGIMAPPAAGRAAFCFPLCSAHPLLIPTKSLYQITPLMVVDGARVAFCTCLVGCFCRVFVGQPPTPHPPLWRKTQAAGGTPLCKNQPLRVCLVVCLFASFIFSLPLTLSPLRALLKPSFDGHLCAPYCSHPLTVASARLIAGIL